MSVFKNFDIEAGTTFTTLYTVPASQTSVVIGFRVSNISDSESILVDVEVDGRRFIGEETPIPIGSSLDVLGGGKLVMTSEEVVRVRSNVANACDVFLSVLEDV